MDDKNLKDFFYYFHIYTNHKRLYGGEFEYFSLIIIIIIDS